MALQRAGSQSILSRPDRATSKGATGGRNQSKASGRVAFSVDDTDLPSPVGTLDVTQLPPRRANESRSGISFNVGDHVEALCDDRCQWYPATIAEIRPDSSYTVNWSDGKMTNRIKLSTQIRENFQAMKASSDAFFKRALAKAHPKLRNSADLVVNAALEEEVRRRLPLTRRFNALLSTSLEQSLRPQAAFELDIPSGDPCELDAARQAKLYPTKVFAGVSKIAKCVVVTGHVGGGGNMSLNGVYELHPEHYHGRAVYRKTIEKRQREWGELCDPRPQTDAVTGRDWKSQSCTHLARPKLYSGYVEFAPSSLTRYIFFDDRHGAWVIGTHPGTVEIFARCPSVDQVVPCLLNQWDVWDAGERRWYRHNTLCLMKGGD